MASSSRKFYLKRELAQPVNQELNLMAVETLALPTMPTESEQWAEVEAGFDERDSWGSVKERVRHIGGFRFVITLEVVLYILVAIFAIITRFYDLSAMALHHDEGVHSWYSWKLFNGDGYTQEPWRHGPFLYHFTALIYWVFGDSAATSRVSTAICGVAIIFLPLVIRKELGRWGVLTAAFLLALSPMFLYYSRFLREDIFVAFATLWVAVSLVRFVEKPSRFWWFMTMSAFAMLYATKAVYFFYTAIFLSFIFLWFCWQLAPRLMLILGGYAVAALLVFRFVNNLYPAPPIPFELISPQILSDYVGSLVVHPVFWTVLILLGLGTAVAYFSFKEVAVNRRNWMVREGLAEPDAKASHTLFEHYAPGTPAYAVGWLGRHWTITFGGLLLFFVLYSVIYTGFFSSPAQGEVGVISTLFYWIAQQSVERGSQPWFYYFFLVPLYEPLAVMFGTTAAGFIVVRSVRWALHREKRLVRGQRAEDREQEESQPEPAINNQFDEDLEELDEPLDLAIVSNALDPRPLSPVPRDPSPVTRPLTLDTYEVAGRGSSLFPGKKQREVSPHYFAIFLVVWTFGSFAVYSWASEKMPWLGVQLTLPFILLTGWLFQQVWHGLEQYLGGRESRQLIIGNLRSRFFFWSLVSSLGFIGCLTYAITQNIFQRLPNAPFVSNNNWLWILPVAVIFLSIALFYYVGVKAAFLSFVAVPFMLVSISTAGAGIFWIAPLVLYAVIAAFCSFVGVRVSLYAFAAVSFAFMTVFTVRTAFAYAYNQADAPYGMGIYTQTSPDVKRVMDEIEVFTSVLPSGKATPILYDEDSRTPLDFYLRDYTKKVRLKDFTPQGLSKAGAGQATDYPIVIAFQDKAEQLGADFESRYLKRSYVFRWWFGEEQYRNFIPSADKKVEFLKGKATNVTVKDNNNKVLINKGELMTDERLQSIRYTPGGALNRLYDGNGGNSALLEVQLLLEDSGKMLRTDDLNRLWRFLVFREQPQEFGHVDFYLYIRKDLAGQYRQFADIIERPLNRP